MAVIIKILLITLCLYFIGRAVIRAIIFWFLGDAVKTIDHKMRSQKEDLHRQKKKQEGNVTINYQPKTNKSFEKDAGDYIDFEEVK